MSNSYYNHGSYPSTGASGSSASLRAELDAITAGFNLLPTLSGYGGKYVQVNSGGTALVTSTVISDDGTNAILGGVKVTAAASSVFTLAAGKTLTVNNTVTVAGTDGTTLTLPAATDTLVGRTSTDTLTNKTLTAPVIATITNGGNTLTLPSTTDTLVGRATTDTLTNKTLTAPVLTAAPSAADNSLLIPSTSWVNAALAGISVKQIQPITASVASNALTITLNPTSLDFRSPTLGSGTVNTRTIGSAISVVVPSTGTLGTVSATMSRLAVLALDNAGTVELAVVNMSGGNNLDETTLATTTAIAGSPTSPSTIYSTTARTNLPFRVVGYIESTQATAGTWATAPSTIQGEGGQSLVGLTSLGYGQTWQNVLGSRTAGTTYYNTTGRPIIVSVDTVYGGSVSSLVINGVVVGRSAGNSSNQYSTAVGVVPPGGSYYFTSGGSAATWSELR